MLNYIGYPFKLKVELPSNNELLEKFRTIEELKPFMKKIMPFVQSLKVWLRSYVIAMCCVICSFVLLLGTQQTIYMDCLVWFFFTYLDRMVW